MNKKSVFHTSINQLFRLARLGFAWLAIFLALHVTTSWAANGTWTNLTFGGGSWADPLNWNNGVIADGSGSSAVFVTSNAVPVTLDGSRIIGSLQFANTTIAGLVWVLNPGTGGTLTLAGGTPTINANNFAAVNVVLAGTSGMSKIGNGSLTNTAANTYTGATTVSAGILSIPTIADGGVNSPLGAGTSLVFDGGTLSYTGPTASCNRSYTVNASKVGIVNVTTAATKLTLAGVGSSPSTFGWLRKIGAGTLTLDSAATSMTLKGLTTTGGTNEMKSGAITINTAAGAQGDLTNGFVNVSGSTFLMTGGTITVSAGIIYPAGRQSDGTGTFIQNGGLFDGGGNPEYNAFGNTGSFTLNGGTNICGEFRAAHGNGVVNLNGGVLKANTVSCGGAVSYPVYFNGGKLQAKAGSSQFIGNASGVNPLVYIKSGGAVIDSSTFGVTIPVALQTDAVSLGGGLTKIGSGTLTLTATNTFTGPVLITNGTLQVNNGITLASASAITVTNNAQLAFTTTAAVTNSVPLTLTGIGTAGGLFAGQQMGALIVNGSGGSLYQKSAITLAGSSRIGAVSGATNFLNGVISGTGPLSLFGQNAVGYHLLNNNFTYTGDTTLWGVGNNLFAILGVDNALPPATTLTLNVWENGANTNYTQLILNGHQQTLAGLISITNANNVVTNRITGGSATLSTLTISNATAATFIGVLGGPGANDDNLALVKAGTSTLTLTRANTYTGGTTVKAGALEVNGSLSSGVRVQGGGLYGNGLINGSVNMVGGELRPGSGGVNIATLTINNTLALGGQTTLLLNRTNVQTSSQIAGISTLTYGGTLAVMNVGPTNVLGDTYQLFSAASYIGEFSATNLPALTGGLTWNWNPANGTLSVVSGYATTPTNIVFSATSTTLSLTWPGSHLGWYAQSNAVDIADPNFWFNIPGSETATNLDITIDPAQPQVFYRLQMP